MFYASIVRFNQKFGRGKEVVVNAMDVDLNDLFDKLKHKFSALIGEESFYQCVDKVGDDAMNVFSSTKAPQHRAIAI